MKGQLSQMPSLHNVRINSESSLLPYKHKRFSLINSFKQIQFWAGNARMRISSDTSAPPPFDFCARKMCHFSRSKCGSAAAEF